MRRLSVESWALVGVSVVLWGMGVLAVVALLRGDLTAIGSLVGSSVAGASTTVMGVVFVRNDLRRRR